MALLAVANPGTVPPVSRPALPFRVPCETQSSVGQCASTPRDLVSCRSSVTSCLPEPFSLLIDTRECFLIIFLFKRRFYTIPLPTT